MPGITVARLPFTSATAAVTKDTLNSVSSLADGINLGNHDPSDLVNGFGDSLPAWGSNNDLYTTYGPGASGSSPGNAWFTSFAGTAAIPADPTEHQISPSTTLTSAHGISAELQKIRGFLGSVLLGNSSTGYATFSGTIATLSSGNLSLGSGNSATAGSLTSTVTDGTTAPFTAAQSVMCPLLNTQYLADENSRGRAGSTTPGSANTFLATNDNGLYGQHYVDADYVEYSTFDTLASGTGSSSISSMSTTVLTLPSGPSGTLVAGMTVTVSGGSHSAETGVVQAVNTGSHTVTMTSALQWTDHTTVTWSSSTLINNMNRIRNILSQINGAATGTTNWTLPPDKLVKSLNYNNLGRLSGDILVNPGPGIGMSVNGQTVNIWASGTVASGDPLSKLVSFFIVSGLVVTAGTGLNASVATGEAYIGGYYFLNSVATVGVAATSDNYIDWDGTNFYVRSCAISGTPSAAISTVITLAKVTTGSSSVTSVTMLASQTMNFGSRTLQANLIFSDATTSAVGAVEIQNAKTGTHPVALTSDVVVNVGDLLYCSATGTPPTVNNLAVGTSSQVLTGGSIPAWGNLPVGATPLTTEGDLLYRHSGALARLAVGSSSQILLGGSDPVWGSLPAAATPLTTEGDLLYYHSGGLSRLAVGTASQVFVGGTDPAWGNVPLAALPAHAANHEPGGSDDIFETGGSWVATRAENGPSLRMATGTLTTVSGVLYLFMFTAKTSFTASYLQTAISTAATSATLAQMGLFTVSSSSTPKYSAGNQSFALVAATSPSGTTLFNSAANAVVGAIAVGSDDATTLTSYNIVAGQRYAIGVLQVGGTQALLRVSNGVQAVTMLAPVLTVQVTGLSAMPTSISTGTPVSNNAVAWVAASQYSN